MIFSILLKLVYCMNNSYTDKSFQGFFTNADDIRHTMIELLGDTTDLSILEPCFGADGSPHNFPSPALCVRR